MFSELVVQINLDNTAPVEIESEITENKPFLRLNLLLLSSP